MKSDFRIIRPVGLKPLPDQYEERVAEICANWFQSDIEFVVRGTHTTPDIMVVKMKQFWEVKNIRGSTMHTIEDNLRKASKQSSRVIVSLLRSPKIDAERVELRIRYILQTKRMPIKQLILVTKNGNVIDIK